MSGCSVLGRDCQSQVRQMREEACQIVKGLAARYRCRKGYETKMKE